MTVAEATAAVEAARAALKSAREAEREAERATRTPAAPGFVRRLIAAAGTLKAAGIVGKDASKLARQIAAATTSTAEAREWAAAEAAAAPAATEPAKAA